MQNTYTTRQEAIDAEIIAAGVNNTEFDVEAIADDALVSGNFGPGGAYAYALGFESEDLFWNCVERHER